MHKKLGPGFVEKIYEKGLLYELKKANIKYISQATIRVQYENVELGDQRVDLIIEDKIIVELKSVFELNEIHIAQMISYLKTSNMRVGLILNFARPKLEIKRVMN